MEALRFDGERLILLDQRRLPLEERYVQCRTYREVAESIRNMTVRGAPAIGVAAAYGLALAAREAAVEPGTFWERLDQAAEHLAATRPTAVNLFWALRRMREVADTRRNDGVGVVVTALRAEAESIHREDIEMNRRIGAYGQELIGDGYRILTHCNAGALATGGYGTALGVIRAAVENGKRIHVYADETRPLLQGARLTAWELMNDGIPVTLITDNMAGQFMRRGKIDFVVVGADRIAANGDVANKIGTYNVAVLARENGIPFYVAAPGSTIDLGVANGEEIVIEERLPEEVTTFAGVQIAPRGVQVANPAFDVTPHRYVTGIITDRGVVYPPYGVNLSRLFGDRPERPTIMKHEVNA